MKWHSKLTLTIGMFQVLALPALAQIEMPHGVIAGGGGGGSGGNYELRGTVGQACIGNTLGAFEHDIGFWYIIYPVATAVADDFLLPRVHELSQNHPNPFNPVTTISYAVPSASHVILRLYDIRGRETARLVDEMHEPGYYSLELNGSAMSSGVYFYRMRAGDYLETRKLVLLK